MTATPRKIEYRGPEGWTVWTDEDGVHLRTPKGECLECGDVQALIALVAEANRQREEGSVPVPRPPSPGEARSFYARERQEHEAKMAARAVYRELSPDTDDAAF